MPASGFDGGSRALRLPPPPARADAAPEVGGGGGGGSPGAWRHVPEEPCDGSIARHRLHLQLGHLPRWRGYLGHVEGAPLSHRDDLGNLLPEGADGHAFRLGRRLQLLGKHEIVEREPGLHRSSQRGVSDHSC